MSFRMILRQTPSVPEMSQSEGERVEGVPFTVIALRRATPGSSVSTLKNSTSESLTVGATTFLYFYNRQTATRKILSLRNQ